jgi:hypothetical protein
MSITGCFANPHLLKVLVIVHLQQANPILVRAVGITAI